MRLKTRSIEAIATWNDPAFSDKEPNGLKNSLIHAKKATNVPRVTADESFIIIIPPINRVKAVDIACPASTVGK